MKGEPWSAEFLRNGDEEYDQPQAARRNVRTDRLRFVIESVFFAEGGYLVGPMAHLRVAAKRCGSLGEPAITDAQPVEPRVEGAGKSFERAAAGQYGARPELTVGNLLRQIVNHDEVAQHPAPGRILKQFKDQDEADEYGDTDIRCDGSDLCVEVVGRIADYDGDLGGARAGRYSFGTIRKLVGLELGGAPAPRRWQQDGINGGLRLRIGGGNKTLDFRPVRRVDIVGDLNSKNLAVLGHHTEKRQLFVPCEFVA
jgi:hypothetical protein